VRPPTLGCFRVLPGPPDEEVKLLRDEIAAYAEREGFTLSEVYMDRDKSQTLGFSALVDALERDDARCVVVPAPITLRASPACGSP